MFRYIYEQGIEQQNLIDEINKTFREVFYAKDPIYDDFDLFVNENYQLSKKDLDKIRDDVALQVFRYKDSQYKVDHRDLFEKYFRDIGKIIYIKEFLLLDKEYFNEIFVNVYHKFYFFFACFIYITIPFIFINQFVYFCLYFSFFFFFKLYIFLFFFFLFFFSFIYFFILDEEYFIINNENLLRKKYKKDYIYIKYKSYKFNYKLFKLKNKKYRLIY
jgi:hypothetical protein